MQAVDHVVHPLDLGDELAVVGQQRRHALAQHGLDDVAHMHRLARRTGQGDARRLHARTVEIARTTGIIVGYAGARRQQSRDERGDGLGRPKKDSGQDQIEEHVEIDDLTGGVALDHG